jgi:hypothetical protein
MKKRTWPVAGLLLVLAACGTPQEGNRVASLASDTATSSSAPPEEDGAPDEDKMRAFAKCMRDNGIDMPDPETDGDGGVTMRIEGEADREAMKKAEEACKEHLPNGGEMRAPSPEDMDKIREQVKCLREKGIDVPEPDFEGGGGIQLPFGDDTERTRTALKECGFMAGGKVKING